MASITQAQAKLFSRADPIHGIYESAPIADEFIDLLSWVRMTGHEFDEILATFPSFGSASWIAAGGLTTDSPTFPVPIIPNLYDLRRVYVDVLIDTFCENIYTSPTDTDIVQMELDAKLKNVRYAIGNALVNGTGLPAPNDPPHGLITLVDPSQVVGAGNDAPNGGALLLTDVDRLLAKITANNGKADLLVMNLPVRQKWIAAHYSNGTKPIVEVDPATGRKVYYHGNVRVAVSDHIPNNETKGTGTNLSSMYAMVLGYQKGICGGYKPGASGQMFEIERTLVETTDTHRYRVSAQVVFGRFGTTTLARLDGIS